jgi:hypothetical protein
MRAEFDSGLSAVVGHLFDILLKEVKIHYHAGSRQNVLGDIAEVSTAYARFEFRIREGCGSYLCGPSV